MADIPKFESPHPKSDISQHQALKEEDERSSSQQTLDNSVTNCSNLVEDDDVVNVEDGDVPYIFNLDPFSPLISSFFVPSSSSSYHHHHHQVYSNSCSCCSSEPESESDRFDSTVYPDCLYGYEEEYDQMNFVTDLFDSRGESEHVSDRFSSTDLGISVSEGLANNNETDGDSLTNNIEELGLGYEGGGGGGLRVVRIESDSDSEELGQVAEQNDDERDGLSSVIDRIEEISVSSDGEATVGVEWEILLAVNNLERDLESATDGEGFVYTPMIM